MSIQSNVITNHHLKVIKITTRGEEVFQSLLLCERLPGEREIFSESISLDQVVIRAYSSWMAFATMKSYHAGKKVSTPEQSRWGKKQCPRKVFDIVIQAQLSWR